MYQGMYFWWLVTDSFFYLSFLSWSYFFSFSNKMFINYGCQHYTILVLFHVSTNISPWKLPEKQEEWYMLWELILFCFSSQFLLKFYAVLLFNGWTSNWCIYLSFFCIYSCCGRCYFMYTIGFLNLLMKKLTVL